MRKFLAWLLALTLLLGVFPSLSLAQEQSELLVMYYIVGANIEGDYHSFTKNIGREPGVFQQLFSVDLPESAQVVLQTGGCDNWGETACPDGTTAQVSSTVMQRWQLTDHAMNVIPGCEDLGDQALIAAPESLSGYIEWAARQYPAQRVVLILCDHGSGSMMGYGGMTTQQVMDGVTGGVAAARELNPAFKLDVFNFDACLQGSLEYAMMLRGCADFFIGSEQSENGGQYHDTWLQKVCANPGMSAADIARTIVDSHMDGVETRRVSLNQTLSCVDLSKVEAVAAAYGDFLAMADERLLSPTDSRYPYSNVAISMSMAKEFVDQFDMVDLVDFCQKLMQCADPEGELYPLLAEKLAAVEAVVADAVYARLGTGTADAHGLSTYLPLGLAVPTMLGAEGAAAVLERAYGENSPITSFLMKLLAVEAAGNPYLAEQRAFFTETWPQRDASFSTEWVDKVAAFFATDEENRADAVRRGNWFTITLNEGLRRRVVSAEMSVVALGEDSQMYVLGGTELGEFDDEDRIVLYFPTKSQLLCEGQWMPYTVLSLDEEANTLQVRLDGELDTVPTPMIEDDRIGVQVYLTVDLVSGQARITSVNPKTDLGAPMGETTIGEGCVVHVTYPAVTGMPAPEIDLTISDESRLEFTAFEGSFAQKFALLTLTDVFRTPLLLPLTSIADAADETDTAVAPAA
ncbi:MAG: clostripain-related cysteine peptidase [Eubacteriales bacterium]|nr:clostripain-related cysteine peptidase [Eubacteriales bacterium]